MGKFLSKSIFKKNIEKLIIAFNYQTTKEQMELYYNTLNSFFTDESFPETCKEVLLEERFFPSISVLFKTNTTQLTREEILKKHGF